MTMLEQMDDMGRAETAVLMLENDARALLWKADNILRELGDEVSVGGADLLREQIGETAALARKIQQSIAAVIGHLRALLREREELKHEVTLKLTELDHELAAARLAVVRRRLPNERAGRTRRFEIPRLGEEGALKIYVNTGEYPDGRLGEVFFHADRQGSFTSGALDAVAISISIGLQYGLPLEAFTSKLIGMKFEPAGLIRDDVYRSCASALDLIGRWLLDTYGKKAA